MAWRAGRDAAEEAAGDQGEELVEVEAEGGLVEVGAGVPGTFGGEHQAGVDVETERCCTVLGGRWQFLPIATMHMAVWWASASVMEERPSSKASVSWELGMGQAWESVSQSDGGGAASCGGLGRGGSWDKGCEASGGTGAAAGAEQGGLLPAGYMAVEMYAN